MATFKVNDDGKAPSGLKVGDTVVTAGGTYQVTGVKSDGSYNSEKVSNTTTSTFKGTYSSNPNSSSSTSAPKYDAVYLGGGGPNTTSAVMTSSMTKPHVINNNLNKQSEFENMWDYIQNSLTKPTYESKYNSKIDDMLNQILNRDKFSYNAMNDPLYQQYASMYNREGNRAMNDTLASAAANAGGMNSYAVTAAQQANDYYSSQLNDKIPELYQMAYSMYMDDIDNQVRDLGLLQDMDSTQYNRYRDTMSDWRNDLSFAYNMYRDNMGDWQWDKTFDYNAGRDQLSDSRYESETAYNRALDFLNAGIMPNQDVLDAAGLTENDAANLMAQQLVGGSGGSGGYVGGGETDWDSMFQEAMNSKNPESWLRQKKNFRKYGLSSAPSYNDYLNWLDGQNEITSASQLGTEAMRIANQMSRVTSQNNYQYFADQIQQGVDNGTITEYEADFLLKAMGY